MRRREFVTLLGGAAAALPLAARAQQPAMPVIGVLSSQSQDSEAAVLAAWRQALTDAGYVGGRNVAIEYRFADGQNDRLPMLAADVVRRNVTVLVANTTPPAFAAKAATATIPIVFMTGVDPVEVGLVASFNRPGANVTGVTFLSNKLVAKRLELLAALVPGTAPIGMLAHTRNPNTAADVRDALAAAAELGRTLLVEKVASAAEVEASVTMLVQQRVAALFLAPQADFRLWRQVILALAERHALPTSFSNRDFVVAGGLMSYGPNQIDSYREAGIYTARILKGEKPAELPVLVSTTFDFAINLKTAKALDLTIPPIVLALATAVIE
ncbi:MAG: ABC transporter substrate-binding protein [Xanthobacteraceae bacterium]|jgi:putative ABC transport system substrate-binding protein